MPRPTSKWLRQRALDEVVLRDWVLLQAPDGVSSLNQHSEECIYISWEMAYQIGDKNLVFILIRHVWMRDTANRRGERNERRRRVDELRAVGSGWDDAAVTAVIVHYCDRARRERDGECWAPSFRLDSG